MSKENILSKINKMSKKELLCLARNTSDVEILNILAVNANYEVRWAIVKNRSTSADVLAVLAIVKLASDEEYHVRAYVALNEKTPINTLAILAKDVDIDVRNAVAENRNTSADTLAVLAKDEDSDVRCAVVENKNTSVETLVMLAKDKELCVSENAKKVFKERKEKNKTSMER
jgi:hypothetical protein